MHTEKRNRTIRLQDLKIAYYKELKQKVLDAYALDMAGGIMSRHELEEKVMMYYRHTQPSLQEFYSRYTPEWEAFYACFHLPVLPFMQYLERMQSAFQKRYSLAEFNISYYIHLFSMGQLNQTHDELERLKEHFLDKWYRLLNQKEYNYQSAHIHTLCDDFLLLKLKKGKASDNTKLGSRIQWLLHNYPDLYKSLVPFEKHMMRHPSLRQLVQLLGKKQSEAQRKGTIGGVDRQLLIHHASKSDITGLTLGNDLGSLLPIEYCFLAEESLQPVFRSRFAEKRLQQFDFKSQQVEGVIEQHEKICGLGPYIICVDTSGSMRGEREVLSKSAILAIAKLTEQSHRKCYVINFSDEAIALKIDNLAVDIPKLANFLQQRFDGGTDITPALYQASVLLNEHDYQHADVVLISDFEMPPMNPELKHITRRMKSRRATFYGLVFGNHPEMDYVNLCERYWNL